MFFYFFLSVFFFASLATLRDFVLIYHAKPQRA